MAKYRRNISEAPIDYEGPERMDPSILMQDIQVFQN
jgi:hypothetical protein